MTTSARPRARGWIHLYSALVAAIVGIALTATAAIAVGGRAAFACAVYSLTVCGLFGISALYHRRVWSERGYQVMRRLDHSMIFLFIAGTYTPISLLALPPGSKSWVLQAVWGGALVGAVLKLSWRGFPRWLGVPIYLALGWAAVLIVPELQRAAGDAPVVLLCVGGLLYTVGTAMFALHRPNPWPGVFGFHEMFHAAVSLAASCHCVAIWLVLFR